MIERTAGVIAVLGLIVAAPLAMLALGAMLLAPHSASADQRDFTLVNHTGQLSAAVQHHDMDGIVRRHPPIVSIAARRDEAQTECGSSGSWRPEAASSSRTTENASPEA